MNKKEFEKRVRSIKNVVCENMNGVTLENPRIWFGKPVTNVFAYGITCERCMEQNLMKGERKTTFMSDLSIAEFMGGADAVFDTIRNAMTSWRDDEEYMAEFILCCNFKSWEHHGRGNMMWCKFWAIVYELVRDLVYDYYEGDEEKTHYVWEYLD